MSPPESPNDSQRLGRSFILVAWLLALGLLTLFFSKLLDEQRNPNQQVRSQIQADGVREVTLQRNRFGHDLGGARPGIVVGTHGEAIGAGRAHGEQVALGLHDRRTLRESLPGLPHGRERLVSPSRDPEPIDG